MDIKLHRKYPPIKRMPFSPANNSSPNAITTIEIK